MQYSCDTGSAALALVAGTARTILRVASATNIGFELIELSIAFDLTSAGSAPALVELLRDDGITGGTSSSITPAQMRGSTATATITAASYSVEPTYTSLVVLKRWLVPPTSGMILQFPLGRESEGQPGTTRGALGLRVTQPGVAVNVRAYMEVVQGPS